MVRREMPELGGSLFLSVWKSDTSVSSEMLIVASVSASSSSC